jgi:hypothetical protein
MLSQPRNWGFCCLRGRVEGLPGSGRSVATVQETLSTALRHSDRDSYGATIREANETIARALRSLRSAAVMAKDAP